MKTGRNDPCPCGSGQKFKKCCEGKPDASSKLRSRGLAALLIIIATIVVVGVVLDIRNGDDDDVQAGRVWSPEHGHYHAPGQNH